jgi:hypothetical protein
MNGREDVNGTLALLVDSGNSQWLYPAIASVVIGVLFLAVKRDLRSKDELRRKEDEQEEAGKKALQAAVDSLNAGLDKETFERQNAISEESSARRDQFANLGRDVGEIREEMCHDYGERGKARPTFGRQQSGHD